MTQLKPEIQDSAKGNGNLTLGFGSSVINFRLKVCIFVQCIIDVYVNMVIFLSHCRINKIAVICHQSYGKGGY
jgi:hypothetical protein